MPILLSCRRICKSFGARPLFDNITLGISTGERLGLVGPNGSGKTTLLKMLADREPADSGDISRKSGLSMAYVSQIDDLPANETIASVLLNATNARLDHERDAALNRTLAMFEFADPTTTVETLSGGWLKRLSIARATIQEPELLLLDEPTNHLDLDGILLLEEILQSSRFAVMLVSHDRYFLERVTNRTIELNRAFPDGYFSVEGGYSDYLLKKEAFLESQAHQQHALEGKVKREVEWLRRGAQARSTKAQYRIDAAGKLIDQLAEVKTRNSQDRTVTVDFTSSQRKSKELVKARGISRTIQGKRLFKDLDVDLRPGARLGIIGPNGSGKSTLISVLTAATPPDAGSVIHAPNLQLAAINQQRSGIDPGISLRRALAPESDNVSYRGETMHIVGWARRFLFQPEQLDMQVGGLSGGEKARILIANIMTSAADLLVLDEPTNDLDIPTLEVLEDALADFPGAVLLVSHDRHLLDSVATEILSLDGLGGAAHLADYSQWERMRLEGRIAEAPIPKSPRTRSESMRRLSTAEQRELAGMEETILTAESAVIECTDRLSDPSVASDHEELRSAWESLQAAQQRVSRLYERWEELESIARQ